MRWIDAVTRQKFESKIHAGDTALLTNFLVCRPTTPLTQDKFLERQTILESGVSKTAIAVSHPKGNAKSDRLYIAYISGGTAYVKSAAYRAQMKDHIWVDEAFAEPAEDVAICFDSIVEPTARGAEEFITLGSPWVFWVHNGVLTARKLGLLGEVVLASANCTKVSAVRATHIQSARIDFGLVVFFLLNGVLYYRQFIDSEWADAEVVTRVPDGITITDIAAFRTWDYRVGVQFQGADGKVYMLLSQYQGIGKHTAEHIGLDLMATGNQIRVDYRYTKEDEHISLRNITATQGIYGGLYHAGVPNIVAAYNLPDENDDWGHIAVFVFDKHLLASSIPSQYAAFSIVDSRGTSFIAQSAVLGSDGLTVTLTFLDFNGANGICSATYTPGTVVSMAGTALQQGSYSFTPQNLVAPSVSAPEVVSISNV